MIDHRIRANFLMSVWTFSLEMSVIIWRNNDLFTTSTYVFNGRKVDYQPIGNEYGEKVSATPWMHPSKGLKVQGGKMDGSALCTSDSVTKWPATLLSDQLFRAIWHFQDPD